VERFHAEVHLGFERDDGDRQVAPGATLFCEEMVEQVEALRDSIHRELAEPALPAAQGGVALAGDV